MLDDTSLNRKTPKGHLSRTTESDARGIAKIALKACWYTIFVACALVLISRFVLSIGSYSDATATAAIFFAFLILLYLLFLLEGIQVVAIQLKADDGDAEEDNSTSSVFSGVSESRRRRIEKSQRHLVDHFFPFIVGRQFLVIATVVGQAMLLGTVQALPENLAIIPMIGDSSAQQVASWLNSQYATFLIATVLPYWIAQLLSQFLADDRPVPFLKLPAATTVVNLTLIVDRIGIGIPPLGMERYLAKTKHFKQ